MRKLVYVSFALFAVIALGCGGAGTYSATVANGGGQVQPAFNIALLNGAVGNQQKSRALTNANSSSNPLTPPYPATLTVQVQPLNSFNQTATITTSNVTSGYTITTTTTARVNGSTVNVPLTVDHPVAGSAAGRSTVLGQATVTVEIGGNVQTATAFFTTNQVVL